MMLYNVMLHLATILVFFLNIQNQSAAGDAIQLNEKNKPLVW